MKILHATKKYPSVHGGDAVVVSSLERLQLSSGYDVVILTSNCAATERRVAVHRFGLRDVPENLDSISARRLLSLLMLVFTSFRLLRRERPDLIHTHSVDMAFAISFAARLYRIPMVHTFHIVTSADAVHGFVRNRVEIALAKAAGPALITALNRDDLDHLQARGLTAVLLPNGIDMAIWQPIPLPADGDHFRLVSVGRLEQQKNYPLLIRAAALVGEDRDARLAVRIVGDGSLRAELEELIATTGVSDRVSLTGPKTVAEIRELLIDTDAVVICSLYEAMPLALLEAWATGRPVITTAVGMVRPTATGQARGVHLIPDREPATLAGAIRRLQQDRTYRETLVEAGFDEVSRHSWFEVYLQLEEYYAGVLAAARP